MKTVTITDQFGEETQTIFRDGDNVGDLMSYLGFDTSNLEVKLNGSRANMDESLDDGDEISLVSRKVKSGC
jgi:sulfur carrier protein ThiS